jgi:succinyl-diaminopimelate desuccinylase
MTDAAIDAWIDAHFGEEVAFLQALIQVPTDTPPGINAPHAKAAQQMLEAMGLPVQAFDVPIEEVKAAGLQSVTNLLVTRQFGIGGTTILLNAHGDVVPPGEGWTQDPYGGVIVNGAIYGRAAAVSKCDFATYAFALRALEAEAPPRSGCVQLLLTYDEEFGGHLGPEWMMQRQHIRPEAVDGVIAAGFSYQVVTAHNGCLQLEVTVQGKMAHAAIPGTGLDAIHAAHVILTALYAENQRLPSIRSNVPGITHPYLNVGTILGGTNTNVVPGMASFRLDRRMVPEEDPVQVESALRQLIASAAAQIPGIQVSIKRLLLARALNPLPESQGLTAALQQAARAVLGEDIPAIGSPLYTDARLFAEQGIPAVLYGAGPRTVLESHAKQADERLQLEDLRRATKVVARALRQLLN